MNEYKILLSPAHIAVMIKGYYEKYEEKDVTANCSVGKSVVVKKYVPPAAVVNFDVFETAIVEGEPIKVPITIDNDDLERILSTSLGDMGYEMKSMSFEVDPRDPLRFIGIGATVSSKKKEQETGIGSM